MNEFRAQGTWLGCNGLIALALLAGLALAALSIALRAAFRVTSQIEEAAQAARLTDSQGAC